MRGDSQYLSYSESTVTQFELVKGIVGLTNLDDYRFNT